MGFMHHELRTARTPEDAATVLSRLTKPPAWLEGVDAAHPFRGEVTLKGFRLREVTQQRHHHLPFLHGRVTREGRATLLRVRMWPSRAAWVAALGACLCIAFQEDWLRMLVLGGATPVLAQPHFWSILLALAST